MMAKYVDPPTAAPIVEKEGTYIPDDGNEFSTLELVQTRMVKINIEHPVAWSDEDLQAAVVRRVADINAAASWWSAESTTEATTITRDAVELDDEGQMPEPFGLSPADLAPVPAPVVVTAPTE